MPSITPKSLRTDVVELVLNAVRKTGKSAHVASGERVSELVFDVAIMHDLNPVDVQREIDAYSDALDAHTREIARLEHDASNVDAFHASERRAFAEHAAALRDELASL